MDWWQIILVAWGLFIPAGLLVVIYYDCKTKYRDSGWLGRRKKGEDG